MMRNMRSNIAQVNLFVNKENLLPHGNIMDRYVARCSDWLVRLRAVSDVKRANDTIDSILESQDCIRTLQDDGVTSSYEIIAHVRHSELILENVVLMLEFGVFSEEVSQHLKRPEYDQLQEEAMNEQMYEEQRAIAVGPGRQG